MQSLGGEELSRVRVAGYDGDALADHAMEVTDLAPALLGVAKSCRRANQLLNGPNSTLSVRMRSELQPGCFHADLELIVKAVHGAAPLIPSALRTATDVAHVMFGEGSVFDLVRRGFFKVKSETTVTATGDGAFVVTGQNNTVTINQNTYYVARDPGVRREAESAIDVLRRRGIDELAIGTEQRKSLITKTDAEALFEAPALTEEQVLETEREAILEVVTFATKREQKSRFSDGESEFWATIDDDSFWDDYHDRKRGIFDGDRFRVVLLTCQVIGSKLKTESVVTRVVNILPPAAAA
jgi:hypothetical protein